MKRAIPILVICEIIFFGLMAREVDTWYQYAAVHRMLRGEAIYRDFAYLQLPMIVLLYAPILCLTGMTLMVGRWIGIAWGIATYWLSRKIAPRFALDMVWLCFFAPIALLCQFETKSYAASFFMVFLVWCHRAKWHKTAALSSGILGLMKLTYMPLGLFYLALNPSWPFALIYAGTILGGLGYFYWLAGASFVTLAFKTLPQIVVAHPDGSYRLFGYWSTRAIFKTTFRLLVEFPVLYDLPLAFFSWVVFVSTIPPGGGSTDYAMPYIPLAMLFFAMRFKFRFRWQYIVLILAYNLNLMSNMGVNLRQLFSGYSYWEWRHMEDFPTWDKQLDLPFVCNF